MEGGGSLCYMRHLAEVPLFSDLGKVSPGGRPLRYLCRNHLPARFTGPVRFTPVFVSFLKFRDMAT